MKNHTKVYLSAMGYWMDAVFIPSELSGKQAVDIHHIIGRGKGGEDRIENLMALTREEHLKYGDKVAEMCHLIDSHREFLDRHEIEYDGEYMDEIRQQYANRN